MPRLRRESAVLGPLLAGSLATLWASWAVAGTTGLASVGRGGADVNGDSVSAAVSADGRFVAFATRATNVLPSDSNGILLDVIVRDLATSASILASQSSAGVQGDADSEDPALSADGSRVVFQSRATNLAARDATPGMPDVYLRDRVAGATTLVSVSSAGEPANGPSHGATISADGRYVCFLSEATNLDPALPDANGAVADAFVRDLQLGATSLVSLGAANAQGATAIRQAVISGNGRYVALLTSSSLVGGRDTNGTDDVYLRDLVAATTVLVSRRFDADGKAAGSCANPAVTFAGDRIAFDSSALNLVDIALPSRRRVYVWEPATDLMRLVSLGTAGENPDQPASGASMSPDGRFVCYSSAASNLVAGDSNGASDVFLHDLATGETTRESVSSAGAEGNGPSSAVFHAVTDVGPLLAFRSSATDLVSGLPVGSRFRIYYRLFDTDRLPPAISCPEGPVAACGGPEGSVVDFAVAATDEIDPEPKVECVPPSGSVFPVGTTEVECTAADASGNTATCTFTVTVEDRAPPEITCPESLRVVTDPAGSPVAVDFLPPLVVDLCDAAPVVECVPPSGSLFEVGVNQVLCSATDSAGNRAACTFDVQIVVADDTTPPTLACPSSVVEVPCSAGGETVVTFEVTATDDLGSDPTVEAVPPSGSAFPLGTTTVTVTARDEAGNASTCSFDVVVVARAPAFVRGDSDSDGEVALTDAVHTLDYLFRGGPVSGCLDAADSNDDGSVDIADPILTLLWLFAPVSEIPPPGAADPGPDPTEDELDCAVEEC